MWRPVGLRTSDDRSLPRQSSNGFEFLLQEYQIIYWFIYTSLYYKFVNFCITSISFVSYGENVFCTQWQTYLRDDERAGAWFYGNPFVLNASVLFEPLDLSQQG